MESKVIWRGDKDYIVFEDGRVFLPKREFTFIRKGTEVRSSRPERESMYQIMKNGYKKCALGLVHRAVAEAFLGEAPNPSDTVNHKDGNKLNNHYSNLEWISQKENINHWIDSDKAIDDGKIHPIAVYQNGEFVNVYRAKNAAAKDLGLHKSTITYVLQGKYKQSGGYTFRKISKKEYYALRTTTAE
jgi:hypothetical protein